MSDTHESQGITERESFENGYYYFVQAVDTLSQPADTQCATNGLLPVQRRVGTSGRCTCGRISPAVAQQ